MVSFRYASVNTLHIIIIIIITGCQSQLYPNIYTAVWLQPVPATTRHHKLIENTKKILRSITGTLKMFTFNELTFYNEGKVLRGLCSVIILKL
jgi:hypothetical protein